MISNIKYIIIGILVLISCFFIGRWTSPKDIKTVTITIPAKKGLSPIIMNPKPLIQFKDSLIYQDSLIYTENPFNKELADKYSKLESEKDKLIAYLNTIQIRKYKVPFENDTIKIVGDFEVQGELRNVKYAWEVKQFKTEATFEVPKPTMNLLVGAGVSNTVDLNKFNINANLGLQRKNGDVILGSYGILDKSIQVGYLINLKL